MEDKGILKQYASLLNEIIEEEKRIARMQTELDQLRPKVKEVTDIVTKGKRGKKPLGIVKINGMEDYRCLNKKRANLRKRKALKDLHIAQLEQMVIDVETYIYTLPESEMRRILLDYCVDRMTWEETAKEMGEGYTAEMCRQKFSRFIRQK